MQAKVEDKQEWHHVRFLLEFNCRCSRLSVSVQQLRLKPDAEIDITHVSCEGCKYKVTANAFALFLLAAVTVSAAKARALQRPTQ